MSLSHIAHLMLRAVAQEGMSERSQIAARVRNQLHPLEVTDDDLQAAADYLLDRIKRVQREDAA